MRNPTIWESASRPLFVRSVWLETASAGRGHQRHFILDYEPRQRGERRLKSAISPRSRRKESLQHSVSYDFSEYDDIANDTLESSEELFLIGSAKVKLQQQPTPQQLKQQKLGKHYRRPSFTAKRQPNYEYYQRQRYAHDLHEPYSRRSSLQDIQSSLSNACSNPDERLAERVLNWLDLAGKTGFLKPSEDIMEHEPMLQKTAKIRRTQFATANTTLTNQKHQRVTTAHVQRSAGNHRKNSSQPRNAATATTTTTAPGSNSSSQHRRPDSVNHITIIFNKEGVPVRLNRPARNIDLCALSSSAVTTRRLAGPLASARLYNSADSSSGGAGGTIRYTSQTALSTARRRLDGSGQDAGKSALQKLLHDEAGCGGLHDAKKQLHIFMPSLPKKGLLTAASTDETASALSTTFSELCKV